MNARSARSPSRRGRAIPPGTRPFVAGALAGSGLAALFGRGRRTARERALARARHIRRLLERRGRTAILVALGRARGRLHRLRPPAVSPLDDAGLAHRVESMLFRDRRVPKGEISINAEKGTVFLRGQVESAGLIDDVVEAVRGIPGVEDVVNLLHLPGAAAPHARTPAARV